LQQPWPDDQLRIVKRGEDKEDGAAISVTAVSEHPARS
jgi:hypothetical protein